MEKKDLVKVQMNSLYGKFGGFTYVNQKSEGLNYVDTDSVYNVSSLYPEIMDKGEDK